MTTIPQTPTQSLYDEFGRAAVGRMRRRLTARDGWPPGHIELFAALALQAGPQHRPPVTGGETDKGGNDD